MRFNGYKNNRETMDKMDGICFGTIWHQQHHFAIDTSVPPRNIRE
jgi:hypothetical protein